MSNDALLAISPVDGRYQNKLSGLNEAFSEYALIKYRVQVELAWIDFLADTAQIKEIPVFSQQTKQKLKRVVTEFSVAEAKKIKEIESKINHDVKAVEYYLKELFNDVEDLKQHMEFIHFGCTSEDINNLAYALMLRDGIKFAFAAMDQLVHGIRDLAHATADQPMLCRTHGQPASPSTMGKELANSVFRLDNQLTCLRKLPLYGKINGAVGNYNAHMVTYPEIDWPQLAKTFVEQRLGLDFCPYTTQIESHDYMANLFDGYRRFNIVLLDFCRDTWGYISLSYFKQKTLEQEVGSSTMPHKVNPIDFENAEGNLGIANALLGHFSEKLPVSRWQRDLSDSTVLRNIGVAIGHCILAYKSCLRGVCKLELNPERMNKELDANWEVLAEAIQTMMRRYNLPQPYEQLKALTRDKTITAEQLREFVSSLSLPQPAKQRLLELTPHTYIGCANKLAKEV